jgi:hypothetical protein
MAGPVSIPAATASGLNQLNHEVFAMFAYGVKDWAVNQPDEAGKLLRQFRDAKPAGPNAWIAELKPLASSLLDDQTAFQMAADRLKSAVRPEQRNRAIAELKKMKGPFVTRAAQLEKTIPPPKPVSLPKLGDWTPVEFGTPDVLPEATTGGSGGFTIKAGGADLWNNADNGLFIYRMVSGDFELVANVASLTKADASTKAALMIRESVKADSRNVAMVVTPANGTSQQQRTKPGAPTTSVKAPKAGGSPRWLKLVRKGDEITGFHSADGQTWTAVTTNKLEKLPASTAVGIAVASHSGSTATTVKVDSVLLTPVP